MILFFYYFVPSFFSEFFRFLYCLVFLLVATLVSKGLAGIIPSSPIESPYVLDGFTLWTLLLYCIYSQEAWSALSQVHHKSITKRLGLIYTLYLFTLEEGPGNYLCPPFVHWTVFLVGWVDFHYSPFCMKDGKYWAEGPSTLCSC